MSKCSECGKKARLTMRGFYSVVCSDRCYRKRNNRLASEWAKRNTKRCNENHRAWCRNNLERSREIARDSMVRFRKRHPETHRLQELVYHYRKLVRNMRGSRGFMARRYRERLARYEGLMAKARRKEGLPA